MRKKASEAQGNADTEDRKTLKAALSTMSLDQLRELRSTIVRLKHLPFTKLTEVLFTEFPSSEGDLTGSARICEDSHAFAYEFRGHCEAEATRTLFEDVENILKIREKEAGQ